MRKPYSPRLSAELAEVLRASGWAVEGGEVRRPAWHARAACRGAGPGAFFPPESDKGESRKTGALYAAARERYCAGCPVVAECAEAGAHEAHGLWGGLSPGQRRRRQAA